jgi:hypothetical protein
MEQDNEFFRPEKIILPLPHHTAFDAAPTTRHPDRDHASLPPARPDGIMGGCTDVVEALATKLDCADFTKNPDQTWTAHAHAKIDGRDFGGV